MGNNRNRALRNGVRVQQAAPKYTTGLGDGHVEDSSSNAQNMNNDDEMMVQKVIKARLHNRQPLNLRNTDHQSHQHKSRNDDSPDDVTVMFPGSNNKNNENSKNFRGYTGSNFQFPIHSKIHTTTTGTNRRSNGGIRVMRPNDAWDTPAIYLVAVSAIVVVSVVVVHLIAVGTNHQHNQNNFKSEHTSATLKKQKRQKVLLKKYSIIKKDDTYNEDANDDDDDLPNESIRHNGGGGTSIATAGSSTNGISDSERTTVLDDVTSVSHPLLYHSNCPSYQQKPISNRLQHHNRHRMNSASSTNANITGTGTSNVVPPLPQVLCHQPQQPGAVTTTTNVVSSRSHHLNQSGSAVAVHTVPKSPMIHQRITMTNQNPSILGYCPPSPILQRITPTPLVALGATTPHVVQQQPLQLQQIHHQGLFQSQSSELQHQQRAAPSVLNARPMSASKLSFESLLSDGNTSFDDELNTLSYSHTPQNNYNRLVLDVDDFAASLTVPRASSTYDMHDAVLSTPKMGQSTRKCSSSSFSDRTTIENTPRIANGSGRQHNRYPSHLPQPPPVPEDSPLIDVDSSMTQQQHYDHQQRCSMMPLMPPPPLVGTAGTLNRIDLSFAQSPKIKEQQRLHGAISNTDSNKDTMMDNMKFAKSPNALRRHQPYHQQQQMNSNNRHAIAMPFVPNLTVEQIVQQQEHNREPPPQSVNLDRLLQVDRSLESGNIIYWAEQIVSKESQQLQNRIFPGGVISNNNIRDSVLAASDRLDPHTNESLSGNASITIPSNDPRKSMHHKRDDLTDDTDSAASLQGSMDFSELKLIEVIGGGGFGQVWKASWRCTPVAVKVLTGSAQSKRVPRAVLEEFAAEINLLKGMRHPNICLYMGACLKPPNRAIITELAANGSLWDALRLPLAPPYVPCDGISRDGWPDCLYVPDERYGAPPTFMIQPRIINPAKGTWHWVLVQRVAFGVARGLSYLHGGIIPVLHRDLKSANILLDESYTAKLCDFGLSRLKAQERSMTGNCGTVQWMAPEVLANQSYNEKADVYSYGVILWELLTRQCPYDKLSPIQCALAVLQKDQRPVIPKWCPPSFYALIQACWKKDPDERPTFPEILVLLEGMP